MSDAEPKVSFQRKAMEAQVTAFSLGVLRDIMRAVKVDACKITSVARTAAEQARAMFVNLEALGVASQKKLYGPAGDSVIDAYVQAKAAGLSASAIQARMLARIEEIGVGKVTRHAADPKVLNVFDIGPGSISPAASKPAFAQAVRKDKRVSRFFEPEEGDPAYHLEIPQPKKPA